MNKAKFWKRTRLYLIGVSISCLVLYFTLWQGKSFGWMPNARVIILLQRSSMAVMDKEECLLNCHNLTLKDIHDGLKDADVDFGGSKTNTDAFTPKEYLVEMKDKKGLPLFIRFEVLVKDSASRIIGVYPEAKPEKPCDCK